MFNTNQSNIAPVYTPDEVAKILKLSKNTVYALIKNGDIIAKKIGKVYRVPSSSLSFVFNGLDNDLLVAEQEDRKSLPKIHGLLKEVRASL